MSDLAFRSLHKADTLDEYLRLFSPHLDIILEDVDVWLCPYGGYKSIQWWEIQLQWIHQDPEQVLELWKWIPPKHLIEVTINVTLSSEQALGNVFYIERTLTDHGIISSRFQGSSGKDRSQAGDIL